MSLKNVPSVVPDDQRASDGHEDDVGEVEAKVRKIEAALEVAPRGRSIVFCLSLHLITWSLCLLVR